MAEYEVAGRGLARVDAPDKAAGRAKFAADVPANQALIGLVLRSPHAHARVLSVDVGRARRISGVRAVVSGADCPEVRFGAEIKDQSLLAREGVVRYAGEPVAAVAAESLEAAQAALEAVRVRYEVLEPVVDAIAAREGKGPVLHENWSQIGLGPGGEGNVIARYEKLVGDPEAGFAAADRVFEHTFTTPFSHAAYIEPHACLAEAGANGRVTIWTTTQSPFDARADVAEALGMPESQVRIVPTEIGGGFGGKIRVCIEPIAALLTMRTGQPVRLEMTREEDHIGVNPRHSFHIRIRTGVKADGTFVARDMDLTLDHGAYGRGAQYTASSKLIMAASSYRIPSVRIRSCIVYSNAPVCGPVRAPGGPQFHFATEVHLDLIARGMGLDPFALRRRNAIRAGETSLFGFQQDDGLMRVLDRTGEEVGWKTPVRAGEAFPDGPGWRFGRGMACGFWPGPGGGASCAMRLNEDGSVQVVAGSVNLTGATTSMCQIAAEELSVGLDAVHYESGDTDTAPRSVIAAGSMMTRSLGAAVLNGARDLKEKILAVAAEKLEAAPEDLALKGGRVFVRAAPERGMTLGEVAKAAPGVRGFLLGAGENAAPPPCPIHTAQVAEVAVHPELGEVRVLRLTCVQDVGFAINPLSVAGQIEGGMVQGMGLALMEEQPRSPEGQLAGASFHEYLIPTSLDMPELKAVLLENPARGKANPYGARGVGEPPIIATAAAIANAILDATGKAFFSLPIGPHHIRGIAGNGSGG